MEANFLEVPLSDEVVKEKTRYYLGTFVGYFLGIYVCMYLFSSTNFGRATARRLYSTSFQSQLHQNIVTKRELPSDIPCIRSVYKSNGSIRDVINHENMLASMGQGPTTKRKRLIDNMVLSEDEHMYSKGFRDYVNQRRTILGCDSFLYPNGYVAQLPSWIKKEQIVLPPGRFESILMYICSNHPLFTCFYFMEGSRLGAHGTRILYLGKDIVVFVLYQFSHMLLGYLALDNIGLSTFINLFVITPSAVTVGLVLQYLYSCPCTDTIDFKRKYAAYESTVLFLGRLAILPLILLMGFSLFLACLFSNGRQIPLILVNYFVTVQFYGVLLGLMKVFLLFRSDFYYRLSLFGAIDLLCIGNLFVERIVSEELVVNVDYAHRSYSYLGIVGVTMILNRDDAIKAKWIGPSSSHTVATSYASSNITSNDDENDVEQVEMKRESRVMSYDNIYDEEIAATKSTDRDTAVEGTATITTTINPLMANIASKRQVLEPVPSSSATNDDDEDALLVMYVDYQRRVNNASSDEGGEELLSFQDWKLKRKEFKQGTRKSFVKAFQVFEEREQLVVAQSQGPSASMGNVVKLYKNVQIAKNALLKNVNRK